MNWTTGPRTAVFSKRALHKQRDFFEKQRVRKHTFMCHHPVQTKLQEGGHLDLMSPRSSKHRLQESAMPLPSSSVPRSPPCRQPRPRNTVSFDLLNLLGTKPCLANKRRKKRNPIKQEAAGFAARGDLSSEASVTDDGGIVSATKRDRLAREASPMPGTGSQDEEALRFSNNRSASCNLGVPQLPSQSPSRPSDCMEATSMQFADKQPISDLALVSAAPQANIPCTQSPLSDAIATSQPSTSPSLIRGSSERGSWTTTPSPSVLEAEMGSVAARANVFDDDNSDAYQQPTSEDWNAFY
ncbi:hypothetical protein HDU88_000901 [Geranomyces variabilis]|nr:hypothetical protein HDU88_000901 [Geranomyces variabilis]